MHPLKDICFRTPLFAFPSSAGVSVLHVILCSSTRCHRGVIVLFLCASLVPMSLRWWSSLVCHLLLLLRAISSSSSSALNDSFFFSQTRLSTTIWIFLYICTLPVYNLTIFLELYYHSN